MSKIARNSDGTFMDPMCDPDHPVVVEFKDIEEAAQTIKNHIVKTPCDRSKMSDIAEMEVYLKKEFMQQTGSFKERGACNTIDKMSDCQKKIGIVAASAGNHAQACAWHGLQQDIPVTVVMPVTAPVMKIERCLKMKANVIVEGSDMGEAKNIAMKMSVEKGYAYINGFDNPWVIAGQGTCALEIDEQIGECDAIVIPVGGGSLVAGISVVMKHLHPNCKIISCETNKCAAMDLAIKTGKPTYQKVDPTIADGLAVPVIGYNSFATAKPLIDKHIVVKEEFVALAMLQLAEIDKIVVEGAGATAVACLFSGQMDEFKGKKVCCINSGGNVDTTMLSRIFERGMAVEGRLLKFRIAITNKSAAFAELLTKLTNLKVEVKNIHKEKPWIRADIFTERLQIIVETRGVEHSNEVRKMLLKDYTDVEFNDHTCSSQTSVLST